MTKAASCWSRRTKDSPAPMTHMITTLYTDMPMYLESLRAGMDTCLVSQAKKIPKACVVEWITILMEEWRESWKRQHNIELMFAQSVSA